MDTLEMCEQIVKVFECEDWVFTIGMDGGTVRFIPFQGILVCKYVIVGDTGPEAQIYITVDKKCVYVPDIPPELLQSIAEFVAVTIKRYVRYEDDLRRIKIDTEDILERALEFHMEGNGGEHPGGAVRLPGE